MENLKSADNNSKFVGSKFDNRVYGCAVIKSINSNYNADFSGQPRTLPSGIVYATDKAFKYACRNYLKNTYKDERIFYFKSLNEKLNPRTLDDTYKYYFNVLPAKDVENTKLIIAGHLLQCLDIRLFGATYAGKTANISVHGPVQVGHGINIFKENNIYNEQINSPFANSSATKKASKKNKSNDNEETPESTSSEPEQTTLGAESKLEEGHYIHHFSINPNNIHDLIQSVNNAIDSKDCKIDQDQQSHLRGLTYDDIGMLKDAMKHGVSYYDSASKIGCDNELLIWVELHPGSNIVLPSFNNLIEMKDEKENGKNVFSLEKLEAELKVPNIYKCIDKIEIYYDSTQTEIGELKEIENKVSLFELNQ